MVDASADAMHWTQGSMMYSWINRSRTTMLTLNSRTPIFGSTQCVLASAHQPYQKKLIDTREEQGVVTGGLFGSPMHYFGV